MLFQVTKSNRCLCYKGTDKHSERITQIILVDPNIQIDNISLDLTFDVRVKKIQPFINSVIDSVKKEFHPEFLLARS